MYLMYIFNFICLKLKFSFNLNGGIYFRGRDKFIWGNITIIQNFQDLFQLSKRMQVVKNILINIHEMFMN